MTEAPVSPIASLKGRADLETISQLVDRNFKPGTSLSFGLTEGTVNITLDSSGDWTIMVGLRSKSERIVTTMFSLESLGFFRAAENDGTVYLLWTSALEEGVDPRSIVEGTLLETLKALQHSTSTQYIS